MGSQTGKEGHKEWGNGELMKQKTTERMWGGKGKKYQSGVKRMKQKRNAREGPNTVQERE